MLPSLDIGKLIDGTPLPTRTLHSCLMFIFEKVFPYNNQQRCVRESGCYGNFNRYILLCTVFFVEKLLKVLRRKEVDASVECVCVCGKCVST